MKNLGRSTRTMLALAGMVLTSATAQAADPAVTDPDFYKVIFENDRVRVMEYQDQPGDKTQEHGHPAFVVYALSAFERQITLPDGKVLNRSFKAGDVMFSEAQTHVGENVGTTPTHIIMVELK